MSGGMTIRELITSWGYNVDDKALDAAEKKLQRVRAAADKSGDAATSAFDRPRDAIGRFVKYRDSIFSPGGGAGKILGGYAESISIIQDAAASARREILWMLGAFTVGSVGLAGFFRLAGSMEQTEIAFETMIGDAEKAKKTLAELQQFAKTTPFNFADTAELSKRLLAFSFQAEELIPIMTSLGNIAAGVGKEKLPQLVLALGQVKAAGKLRGSELRQFTEAGVPLIAELAKTLKVADSEVQQMVENGKVGFKDVWMALQAVTSEGGRFNNLMKRQSGSLLGIFSNLVDTVQLLAVDLGKKGLLGRAKEFLLGILNIMETNRKEILEGMAHAVDMVVGGLQKLIALAKGAWRVFQGLAQVVGGTRRALDLLIKGLFLIASARMLFLLGKTAIGIAGLAKSWMLAGNAAMLAQIKMAAIPIAIGAAIAFLALMIEDIVGYFQGRKSITGLILKDIDNIGAGFAKIFDPIIAKAKEFGAKFGQWIIEGIKNLSETDWNAVGDFILKALEFILNASTIPLRIGLAIAEGILNGLLTGIRERFPKLAAILGINEDNSLSGSGLKAMLGMGSPEDVANYNKAMGLKAMAPENLSAMDKIARAKDMLWGATNWFDQNFMRPSPSLAPAPSALLPSNARSSVRIDAPISIHVPQGTPPEKVGPFVQAGIESWGQHMRETQRQLSSPIEQ